MRFRLIAPLILLSCFPADARSTDKMPAGPPKALDALIACKNIAQPTDRLACYDKSVAQLQTATAQHDIVVVDRAEVREARHSLFGFNLPSLAIFGSGEKNTSAPVVEEEKEISATIQAARQDGAGNWMVTLDSGAVWHQTDEAVLGYVLKPGMPVTIRRAAFGSYFLRVGNKPGFKAKREG
jgi:hypothetical protein